MTNAGLADQPNQLTDDRSGITRATVLKVFVIIAVVSFVLRIAYAGHFYEDDGLWFTSAEEILRGKALYREIYFDKPPGLALIYAILFWIFGAHIMAIRLFMIAYSIAISAMLYLFGARLYDKRIGLLAAGLFAVFSTTYSPGHVHGLGTDFLMALPYTAGAYMLVRAIRDRANQGWVAAAGGALAGVAFQINPKGIFDLLFFAVLLIAHRRWTTKCASADATEVSTSKSVSSFRLFVLASAGVAAGWAPFLAYVAATRSLRDYWLYVWDWGARYRSYYGVSESALKALIRSTDYFTLNNTLLIALIFLTAMTIRSLSRGLAFDGGQRPPGATLIEREKIRADAILLIWFAVSFSGVALGGRFFPHYFIQIVPSLSLIGARGLAGILLVLRGQRLSIRRGAIAIIAIGFAFTLIRFHGRGVLLSVDFVTGTLSASTEKWDYYLRDREERMAAAVVREFPDDADAADHLGLESIRAGGPRMRPADGPSDYLFVWGYRPEIYYWSGLLPASRYLSTQPLTGVPADVHFFSNDYRSVLDEASTASARAQLIGDLEETGPKYIVDELGMFNADLSITSYAELKEFMRAYKPISTVGRFRVYCRRDLLKKNLRRMREKEQ